MMPRVTGTGLNVKNSVAGHEVVATRTLAEKDDNGDNGKDKDDNGKGGASSAAAAAAAVRVL